MRATFSIYFTNKHLKFPRNSLCYQNIICSVYLGMTFTEFINKFFQYWSRKFFNVTLIYHRIRIIDKSFFEVTRYCCGAVCCTPSLLLLRSSFTLAQRSHFPSVLSPLPSHFPHMFLMGFKIFIRISRMYFSSWNFALWASWFQVALLK